VKKVRFALDPKQSTIIWGKGKNIWILGSNPGPRRSKSEIATKIYTKRFPA